MLMTLVLYITHTDEAFIINIGIDLKLYFYESKLFQQLKLLFVQ
ncbi:hypothetical protein CNEO4_90025 [Clostridium neonatale]|nr:hypothetical protein CNEO3_290024 [Clostridium neonatale]CAI3718888.1 hypothetical protein CNEO4_90025 [Clostridium neonatale]